MMRPALVLLLLVPLTAQAQPERGRLGDGSCRVAITPRQEAGHMRMAMPLLAEPKPGAEQTALLGPRAPVTITAHCAQWVRVKDTEGREGWVSTGYVGRGAPPPDPDVARQERMRQEEAQRQADLEALRRGACAEIRSSTTRRGCEERQHGDAMRAPIAGGGYLSGEELRQLVAGKTLEVRRPPVNGRAQPQATWFFRPDGQVFYRAGEGGYATRWRGPWHLEGDALCTRGAGLPCWRVHRASGGQLAQHLATGHVQPIAAVREGDPTHTEAEVRRFYPDQPAAPHQPTYRQPGQQAGQPQPPAPPGILGPSLSR
jgi:hypothetical protein